MSASLKTFSLTEYEEVNMCCTYVVDEHRCNTVESHAFFRRNHASPLSAADSAAPSFFIFLSAAM